MQESNIQNEQPENEDINWNEIEKSHRRGKIMGGLLIVLVGSLFLARELGAQIPFWVFSWKMLLIGLGLVLAVKHKFLHPGWCILIAIGGAFLLTDIYPELNIKPILWPSLLILIGIAIMIKPRKKHFGKGKQYWEKRMKARSEGQYYRNRCENDFFNREAPSKEDYLESTTVFGGVKKNIISKNFKGGEITNIFGGSEINLSQADFEGTARLEITEIFGGTKLIVPSHWEIRSEVTVAVFGSVEDKRVQQPSISSEPAKVLILSGTTVFGGIDIKSF